MVTTGRAADVVFLGGQAAAALALAVAFVLGSPNLAVVGVTVAATLEVATRRDEPELRARLRRVGIDEADRAVLRALAVLVIALPLAPWGVGAGYAVGAGTLFVASRSWLWAHRKVTTATPIVAARNLSHEHDLSHDHLVAPSRRRPGATLIAAAEVPLAAGVAVAAAGQVALAGAILMATVAALLGVTGWVVSWALRVSSDAATDRHVQGLRSALEAHGASVLLYFSGVRDTTYQVNQWVPVLDRLEDLPVTIVVRERHHLDALAPTRWPVLFCRTTRDVEDALTDHTRVALYVSNAGRNIHLQRFGHLTHVFLNHGDSDKASSFNPVVKVYDKIFVAGELGIERYRNAGVDLPDDAFEIVGRPQLDGVTAKPIPVDPDGPRTVLYAPTWEGLFDEVNYSSVEAMGLEIVETILREFPQVRIIFKPHPMTGTVRPSAGRAAARITERLRDAGQVIAADEPEVDLLGWFERADVLITDVSAVATDWLATGRPLGVTLAHEGAQTTAGQLPIQPAASPIAEARDAVELVALVSGADDGGAALRLAQAVRVLGNHGEGPQATFERVLRTVIERHPMVSSPDRDRR